ncbi:putative integral membrane protein [Sphingobium sp. OAS761]|uniref:lipopolysaccharide assembly protein LapA domain-containing protein n=1 Tax=Sphingobium sp. OAS761 TaxID=2817901 RepID=UPI0020A092D6|nr:lipopolysaccharide assembly protein LapA domain-containing protein [Sphingobium sp. OAS761]MCP1468754.1 putative integral membrane protein [Sphingobium sp. OAS761]
MQFLRTAFWVVIAVALAFFCMANYVPVTVRLWGDIILETKLPVLLIGAFLLGALPFWVMARATRWRMRRRLDSTERALAAATSAAAPPPSPAFSDAPAAPGTDGTTLPAAPTISTPSVTGPA